MVLFRVRGVPVKVGWSWLVISGLVCWSLAVGFFPAAEPDLSPLASWTLAVLATLLFFVSILLHELSHTLQSMRDGVPVRDVTLWLFGGVSRADDPIPGPGAELRIVAAGPLASAVLAAFFWGVTALGERSGVPSVWLLVPDWLARVNALLLGFNLVPALPLAVGRLLHALLWWRTKDSAAATVEAALPGRVFGLALVATGMLSLLAGSGLGGLWLVLVGWFLLQAVQQEVTSARSTQVLSGLRVRDLMTTHVVSVPPAMTIAGFAGLLEREASHPAYPVLDDGRLVGLLLLRRAGAVPLPERASVRVADVMLPAGSVPSLRADQLVAEAAPVLGHEPGRALVLEDDGATDGHPLGLLSVTDLSRALEASPGRSHRTMRPPPGRVVAVVASVAVVVLTAAVYHPPVVVLAPGPAIDVTGDITVQGVPVRPATGPYLLTAVQVSQPSALGLLVDVLRTDRQVEALTTVQPPGVTATQLNAYERAVFRESRQSAAVAAARLTGHRATLAGDGARVLALVQGSSAAGALRTGDVVTAAAGRPVATATDLTDTLDRLPAGDALALEVRREGRPVQVTVDTAGRSADTGMAGLGALVATDGPRAVLPFDVTFRPRPDVGGPSAGLAYALALTDLLDRSDDAAGRSVAATGTIAADGAVGPVGGLPEKSRAAEDAGADLLVVPEQQTGAVGDTPLDLLGAGTLAQARQALLAPDGRRGPAAGYTPGRSSKSHPTTAGCPAFAAFAASRAHGCSSQMSGGPGVSGSATSSGQTVRSSR